ncbi:MAG: class IV adenylate cyclase [Planctomycetota bacterium]|nr:class IV adenylate cyclase [Planctomycetota bacterium]
MPIELGNSPADRNVEVKAQLPSLKATRSLVQPIATSRLADQHQVDTYFCAPRGRLKLRTINKQVTQLIWYCRPDSSKSKTSHYVIARVDDPEGVQSTLTGALGIRCRVDKHREIYLCDNVRIHLDTVATLGDFLELEAVLEPEMDPLIGHRQVAGLCQTLSIRDADLIQGSYVDLMEATGTAKAQIPLPPPSPY